MVNEEFEIGDMVELKKPELGYFRGEVADVENGRYIVRFSSGMEQSFYSDEFE